MPKSGYIGKQIGNYRIVTELSRSFYSIIFRGEHIFLSQRVVAIKLLHAYLDSPQEHERFLQEARMLERLRHQHILPIIDFGIYEGLPYLLIEYAQNGSLRDRLQRRSSQYLLSVEEALAILKQVGEALHYAHEQNIVHRDLKPENILFNARNEALLADFNIATVLEAASTQPVDLIGTPFYMAPEQFDGMISTKSDQYALGCIAYELFTGRRPFNATNAYKLGFQHKNEDPPPPTQLNPQLPLHIEQAILKAMRKERAERYMSVSAFIRALQLSPIQTTQSIAERRLQSRLKLCEEERRTCEHAILNPNSSIFHLKRGDLLYNLKRDEEALQAYEQAIQLDAHLAEAYEGKGKVLYGFNRLEEALVAYERAIQIAPHLARAYDGKGWVLWHLNRYEEALAAYEQAIELDPNYFSAYQGKGNSLFEIQHYKESVTAYESAIQLNSQLIYAYHGKANALFELRRYEDAFAAYEEAIRLDPKFAYAYHGKANALWGLKRFDEALVAYEQAIQLDPSTGLHYKHKGDLLKWLGRLEEAEQAYQRAQKLGYRE